LNNRGRAASRSAIIEAVWGFEKDVEPNTVDAFIKLLRDKIDSGHDRKLIQTVRGIGYMIEAPDKAAEKPEEQAEERQV